MTRGVISGKRKKRSELKRRRRRTALKSKAVYLSTERVEKVETQTRVKKISQMP